MGIGSSRSRSSSDRSFPERSFSREQPYAWGQNSFPAHDVYSETQPAPPPPPSWEQSYNDNPAPPLHRTAAATRTRQLPQPSELQTSAKPRLDRRYSRISDQYNSLAEVTEALSQAGLESSNLIVGIDFTKSNEWTGKRSFRGRSLHHISDSPNPYEQAISIIGQTLSAFDEDNLIPCFGFGDSSTHDQDIFSFYPDERPCNGFSEALDRYKELVPKLKLAGPTSFAPIIEMAVTIVEESGGQYHVLLIIADGQVTRSVDTEFGQLSSQEQKTVEAIVKASDFPLSIILVGVGDGPWDMMKEFDDNIPERAFDNFQFVNFTEIMSKNMPEARKESLFALGALMEIPSQYKATLELGILGRRTAKSPERVPLPPPIGGYAASVGSNSFKSTSFKRTEPTYSSYETSTVSNATPSAPSSSYDNHLCPICLTNPKDMAFGCGHQTCCECGPSLETCPICRTQITTRIKLY
ncbi:E3 ubiquitin-protein ligase RGLG2-like [Zingiber officinale]|uniref:RING-type domain-containing protein n=1 Tax=Zingiber officinale TaxID=94328 RepID=A0A8J5IVQ6_ZINOF|nr:E3 ubiquitin-protein ligase RGLG2-like [Zingiber officinale]KAG6539228.1 hypothetical protein ZIOFF_004383 [Zingiber officinale]